MNAIHLDTNVVFRSKIIAIIIVIVPNLTVLRRADNGQWEKVEKINVAFGYDS